MMSGSEKKAVNTTKYKSWGRCIVATWFDLSPGLDQLR